VYASLFLFGSKETAPDRRYFRVLGQRFYFVTMMILTNQVAPLAHSNWSRPQKPSVGSGTISPSPTRQGRCGRIHVSRHACVENREQRRYHLTRLSARSEDASLLSRRDSAGSRPTQVADQQVDPVYVGRIGATDGAGIFKRYGKEEMFRHAIWMRELVSTGEWIQWYEQEQTRPVRRMKLIEDLEGLCR
jgi:hypothetical protein